MAKIPAKVFYSASDCVGGTILLDAWEELAYRRICDLIYVTGDNLPDDDAMPMLTKVGRRWPKIRARLVALEKIVVENGRISNPRCRRELADAGRRIEAAMTGALASVEARKSLKENKSPPAAGERPPNDGKAAAQRSPNYPLSTIHKAKQQLFTDPGENAEAESAAAADSDLVEDLGRRCIEAAGMDPVGQDFAIVGHWLAKGYSEAAILGAIGRVARRGSYAAPSFLEYFTDAIADAVTKPAGAAMPEASKVDPDRRLKDIAWKVKRNAGALNVDRADIKAAIAAGYLTAEEAGDAA